MKTSQLIPFLIAGATCIALAPALVADTTQTFGSGSAVIRIDRSAVFDALSQNGTPISDYTEGDLFVGVDGDSRGDFDPFHGADGVRPTFEYPDGGSPGWVTIHATDAKLLYAVEFMYGNGWTTGYSSFPWGNDLAYLEWQTWRGGQLVSSGTFAGPDQIVAMGTIIGFQDPAGFDDLLVRCRMDLAVDKQALAIDSLNVQLLQAPAKWWNYGAGWPGTLGIPGIVAGNPPVLGGGLTITVDNSAPGATFGFLLIGAGETSLPTRFGGTVLVAWPWIADVLPIPAGQLGFAGTLPTDGGLSGLEIDLQCLELDPGASRNISFTPGLALLLGS
jgi:hypothetical protein